MAVAFDAVGPSAAGQTSTTTANLTWTHTAGADGGTVLVYLCPGLTGATAGQVGTYTGVTYGGNAMTLLGAVAADNSTGGGVICYGITGQVSGANTVTASGYTPSGTLHSIVGASVGFTGAGQLGSAVTNFGSSASGTVTVTGTTSGNLVCAGIADGTGGETITGGGTQRYKNDFSSSSGAGAVIGGTYPAGGSVACTWTQTSDFWGVLAIEVMVPAGPGAGPALGPQGLPQRQVVLVSNSGWRNAGRSR